MEKLMFSFKSLLRGILMRNNNQSSGRMAKRDRFVDIAERIQTDSPVIVDGGANRGGTIDLFLKQYKNPTIHAFEPIPELVDVLRNRYGNNKNIFIHGMALGVANNPISFNVVDNLVSSSILSPTETNRNYHGSKMDIKQTVEVPMVRLDNVLDDDIDILKLDLQGYELEALRGCGSLLDSTKIITTEVEFIPLYEGQPLFADIDTFLRSHNFKLLNLYDLWTHPDGQLTAGDAAYLNRRHFEWK
jgi:FkbM family methyltransferase